MQRDRPLDVLFVISALRVGGSERQLAALARALVGEGKTIAVYSLMDGPVRTELEQAGVETVVANRFGRAGIPLAALHLFWFMRRHRPGIVHFFLPAAYLVGAPLAVLARVPVRVMSRRSLNTYQRHALIRGLERSWHGIMQAVIGNSLAVVGQLREEGVVPERLGLIYNGIDSSRFAAIGTRETNRARLNLTSTSLVLCVVANLIPYKGHSDLIEALALATPSLPADWRLLIVGRDDGIGKTLREQARRLGLQNNIVFLGTRNDVANILAASDIGVLPSHEEGFSNAILEGMAAGLPMVATQVGGNAEAVRDGETGLVVAGRDIKGLAAAIVKLANDAPLRARLAGAARERVTQQFDFRRFVQNHHKLYAALQSGRRPVDVPEIAVHPAAGR